MYLIPSCRRVGKTMSPFVAEIEEEDQGYKVCFEISVFF